MLVTATVTAVTHVDGVPVPLVAGKQLDLPDANAKALAKAGKVKIEQAKRQAGAPENKSATSEGK